jgi:predicted transcriptional regulator
MQAKDMWQPKERRTSVEIVADILRLLRLGYASKLEIIHTSRISSEQAAKYLNQLVAAGALENAEDKMELPSYRITRKGLELLSTIENLREMLPKTGNVDILQQSKITEMNVGQVLVTRKVAEMAGENSQFAKFIRESLDRYRRGDWGELSDDDKRLNDVSKNTRRMVLSSYESGAFPEIWIITSPDRLYSTIMFPEEYSSAGPLESFTPEDQVRTTGE